MYTTEKIEQAVTPLTSKFIKVEHSFVGIAAIGKIYNKV
jgi:hypothetical protein